MCSKLLAYNVVLYYYCCMYVGKGTSNFLLTFCIDYLVYVYLSRIIEVHNYIIRCPSLFTW